MRDPIFISSGRGQRAKLRSHQWGSFFSLQLQVLVRQKGSALYAAIAVLFLLTIPAMAQERPPYRVLFSNDTTNITNCTSPYNPGDRKFTEDMLRASVAEAAVKGVDA